jgi:hypothetical protein
LRAIEEENERLKRIVAKQALELEVKSELLKKLVSDPAKDSILAQYQQSETRKERWNVIIDEPDKLGRFTIVPIVAFEQLVEVRAGQEDFYYGQGKAAAVVLVDDLEHNGNLFGLSWGQRLSELWLWKSP